MTIRREQHVLAQWLRQYFCQDHGVRSVLGSVQVQDSGNHMNVNMRKRPSPRTLKKLASSATDFRWFPIRIHYPPRVPSHGSMSRLTSTVCFLWRRIHWSEVSPTVSEPMRLPLKVFQVNVFCLQKKWGKDTTIDRSHAYYYQVQAQVFISRGSSVTLFCGQSKASIMR